MLLHESVLMVSSLESISVWKRKAELQNQEPGLRKISRNVGHSRTLQYVWSFQELLKPILTLTYLSSAL